MLFASQHIHFVAVCFLVEKGILVVCKVDLFGDNIFLDSFCFFYQLLISPQDRVHLGTQPNILSYWGATTFIFELTYGLLVLLAEELVVLGVV